MEGHAVAQETSILDGALIKIVNQKQRLVSYQNCTTDFNITVLATYTVKSRHDGPAPPEYNAIRACPDTHVTRTEVIETSEAAAEMSNPSPSAAAVGGTRRTITFKAQAVIPPQSTRGFVQFEAISTVEDGLEDFATSQCPLEMTNVAFQGGVRRADGVRVSGPDTAGLSGCGWTVYHCLNNPRDPSGATNWLYRLTTAAPDAALVVKTSQTRLWAFYNDSVHAVAHITANFHVMADEEVVPCGRTTYSETSEAGGGGTAMSLTLTVAPLTTEHFAYVTRRSGGSAVQAARADAQANGVPLAEYGVVCDAAVPAAAASASCSSMGAIEFVHFLFRVNPYCSVTPLSFDELHHINLPKSIEYDYDEVFRCPLAVSRRTQTDPSAVHRGSGGVTPRASLVPAAPLNPVNISSINIRSARRSSPLGAQAATRTPAPRPAQRRLSQCNASSRLVPNAADTAAAAVAGSDEAASSAVYLLVNNEGKSWRLHNASSSETYHVFVTAYNVKSPEEWNRSFAPLESLPTTPRDERAAKPNDIRVRRAQSQPGAVVVEVTLSPNATVCLCDGQLPTSFDLACVEMQRGRRSSGGFSSAEATSPLRVAGLLDSSDGMMSMRNISSSALFDPSSSAKYMSLSANPLMLDSPSLLNTTVSATPMPQLTLPDQERLPPGGAVFDGPGPDPAIFPFASLYAVFPRRQVMDTAPSPNTSCTSANRLPARHTLAHSSSGGGSHAASPLITPRESPNSAVLRVANALCDLPPLNLDSVKLDKGKTAMTVDRSAEAPAPPQQIVMRGTNGALFRLVSEDETHWGLYNDTANLDAFVHVIFTMEQTAFGATLEPRQRALGRTQLFTTPWREQQPPPPQTTTLAVAPQRGTGAYLLATTHENNASLYHTPPSESLEMESNGISSRYRTPSRPRPVRLEGLPSPRQTLNRSPIRGAEAGHLARTLLHAVVRVPPHTTVAFLAASKPDDLIGSRFHAWVEPLASKETMPRATADALASACEANAFTVDAVFSGCRGLRDDPDSMLYTLVECPLTRPVRGDAQVAEGETVTPVTDVKDVEGLTRARWAFFNASQATCFVVTLDFSSKVNVKRCDSGVFEDDAEELFAEDTTLNSAVTKITDTEVSKGRGSGIDTLAEMENWSAHNRFRVVTQYSSPELSAADVSGVNSSFPKFASAPHTQRGPIRIRGTILPGELVVFVSAAPHAQPLRVRIRTDRRPQNSDANIAFETGNPVICRDEGDYDMYKAQLAKEAEAAAAAGGLPSHLHGAVPVQGSALEGPLHVNDMLTQHHLRFYRDYTRAPVYRIVNDRDQLWSVFNDSAASTYTVSILFCGNPFVTPLGAAHDTTEQKRKIMEKALDSTRASQNAQTSAAGPRRRLSDERSTAKMATATDKKETMCARDVLFTLLKNDDTAVVIEVTVKPGQTELIGHVEDVKMYQVFLEKQPHTQRQTKTLEK